MSFLLGTLLFSCSFYIFTLGGHPARTVFLVHFRRYTLFSPYFQSNILEKALMSAGLPFGENLVLSVQFHLGSLQ